MTGYPGWYSPINGSSTVEGLWNTFKTELDQGGMLAIGTYSPSGRTYTNGLANSHAYALLSVHTLSNGVRLVKTSNPWGLDSFTGPWSDKDSRWTTALRAEVASENDEKDGVFF